MRRVGRFVGWTLLLAVVAGLASVVYLHAVGLPSFLQRFVLEQLRRNGIAAQFRSVRLDLLRGLVAQDAVVADASVPERPLAQIDQLELQWSWRRLLRRRNAVVALRIANASIAVRTPTDEQGSESFLATDAYATFLFDDHGAIEVKEWTGVYCGLRLQMSGKIRLGARSVMDRRSKEEEARQFLFVTKAVRELNQIRAPMPPQLDLEFDLDLGRPLDGVARVRLHGRDLSWRRLHLDSVAVDVQMRNGAIEVREFRVETGDGDVKGGGRYDIAMGQFDLEMSSSVHPRVLSAWMPPKVAAVLSEMQVNERPEFAIRYALSPETGSVPRLTGQMEARAVKFCGVELVGMYFGFDLQGTRLRIMDAVIVFPEGRVLGQGEYDLARRSFAYELDSTIDPTRLLPVMTPVMRRFVEPACFAQPPRIRAIVAGDFVSMDAFAYDAEVEATACSYRSVPLEYASATLRLRRNQLEVQRLRLVRPEGEVQGPLLVDFDQGRVQFNLGITANPSEVAPLLGEKSGRILHPFRFGARTTAEASGVLDFINPAQTEWTARVSNEGFSWWKLTSDRAESRLVVSNNLLRVEGAKFQMYGGEIEGDGEVELDNHNASYQYGFTVKSCDVNRLMVGLRGTGREVSGWLNGQVRASGRGEDLKTMRGTGRLDVSDAILWEAPLFGIFSRIANDIVPGTGSIKITRAKANFGIEDGGFRTDDLEMSAGVFTIRSHGRLGFDGRLDFRVQAQFLRSLPGINVISAILTKVLEYKVGGSLAEPSYRPVNLPKEILPHE